MKQYNYVVTLRVKLPIAKKEKPINLDNKEDEYLRIEEWFNQTYRKESTGGMEVTMLGLMATGESDAPDAK